MGLRDIPSPDACGEPIDGIVSHWEQLFNLLEWLSDNDRPEDLLLDNAHFGLSIRDHCGRDEVAPVAEALTASYDAGSVALAGVNVSSDAPELFLGDERTHLCASSEPGADLNILRRLRNASNHILEDLLLHQ